MIRVLLCTLLIPACLLGTGRPVISWIPPYNVPVSFENLEKSFDGYGPADGLSHIAPQFWVPDGNGGISYVTRDDYSMDYMNDDSVKVIRDWGNQYGIKTMLCIYNGEHGWDWSLVSTSISAANRQSFVDAIVTEMKRLNLHGVEVDLEGPNADSPTDTENFLLFMEKLSDTLSSLGKDLTIATFASREWDHIPDASHWPELLPLVDGITSMGYEETGINATGDLSYAGQKSMAAGAPEKLMLGMPDHLDSWQGSSALQQVEWAQDNGVGVALWDMQLRNEAWQRRDIWKALSEIRGPLGTTYTVTAKAETGGSITPSGQVSVREGTSQTFTITPDPWHIITDVLIDGESQGAQEEVTLEEISGDTRITARFAPDPDAPELHSFTITAKEGGTSTPAGEFLLAHGEDTSLTITPESGYIVNSVVIDDQERGPLTEMYFYNVHASHTITASFEESKGGDVGHYEPWSSSITPGYRDTVHHNDSLWEYTGDPHGGTWGADMEPSHSLTDQFGTPPWTFAGTYSGIPDTLITAQLQYYGGTTDTLITTTKKHVQGEVDSQWVDTVYIERDTPVIDSPHRMGATPAIEQTPHGLYLAQSGSFTLSLYDPRGRVVQHTKLQNAQRGDRLNLEGLAPGVYVLQLLGEGHSFRRQIHLP